MRKRQYNRMIIVLCSLIGGIIAWTAWILNKRIKAECISEFIIYDAILSCFLLLCVLVEMLFSNRIYKGLRYFMAYWTVKNRLELEMIDAGLCIRRDKYIEVPKIVIYFESDLSAGILRIKNSLRYDKRLDNTVLTSALGRFIVEKHYVSNDGNYYIYELSDSANTYKMTFNCCEDFIKYSMSIPDYELFLDKRSVAKLQHMLLIGQTGSGKTYGLYSILLQMLNKRIQYNLFFADPKGSSLSVLARKVNPENTAVSMNEIIDMLNRFVSLMQERKKELEHLLSEKIDADYSTFSLPAYVFICDEYASFSAILASEEKKVRDKVKALLGEVILQGRQLGFFVMLVMQKSDATLIDTSLRENIPLKVVLGNSENQTYVTAFGAGVDVPNRDYKVGEGVFIEPALAPEPRFVQFPRLDFDIMSAVTRTPVM